LKSQFCNNEVGASWALSLPIRPLIVPPLEFADVRGVLAGTEAAELNHKERLSDLRDEITEKFCLKPMKTSHWERKRDNFLTKLEELLSKRLSPDETTAAQVTPAAIVSTSGTWLKLANRFYKADRFEYYGKATIALQLSATLAEDDAALNRLRPPEHGQGETVGFAYQNEGGLARIGKATSVSHGGNNVWTFELTEEDQHRTMLDDVSYNFDNRQYSPDDVAELRAGRLLINSPPPPQRRSRGYSNDFFESIIAGTSGSPVKIDECIIRSIVAQNRNKLETGLIRARLESVFRLKMAGIVESVLELSLGPLVGTKLHVRFRGQRPFRYQSETPETINVEGECEIA
jgi:hypothetical protein